MNRAWAAICDRCGFRFPSSELKKEWEGLMVCFACWESRHPQDFVRGVEDNPSVPWTRPEGVDVFVPLCYIEGSSGYAGLAIAGCMIAGNNTYPGEFLKDILEGPP
jgi:hypothetical protein